MGDSSDCPASLQAAQERLLALRRQRRQERKQAGLLVQTDLHGRLLSSPLPTNSDNCNTQHTNNTVRGWESIPYWQALQAGRKRQAERQRRAEAASLAWLPRPAAKTATPPPLNKPEAEVTVTLYPDLGLAMLRKQLTAPGRLWLLLRSMDTKGQGWFWQQDVQQQLTQKDAPLYLCGQRQLRNLLASGQELFWTRDKDRQTGRVRIWLRSAARVALALGLEHLGGRPVQLPRRLLLQPIGTMRAHLYAAFHSGRPDKPLARQTLRGLCRRSRQTQRTYEARSGIRRQANWALGPRWSAATEQERAWQHGRALFQFEDKAGHVGRPGAIYLAWQLPNSYQGPHQTLSRNGQRRINRRMADLLHKGTTGNGRSPAGFAQNQPSQSFYRDGQAAVKGYNRAPAQDAYWQSHTSCGWATIWHLLPGRESL